MNIQYFGVMRQKWTQWELGGKKKGVGKYVQSLIGTFSKAHAVRCLSQEHWDSSNPELKHKTLAQKKQRGGIPESLASEPTLICKPQIPMKSPVS